ncbi:L-2-hydroxyglutarate oxidase LhgO [Isoptericola jiangsuensis]|uniref:L-2-hydroxyglutarate oxidase LhgO n=1 Tax=Isoptericola jiangsuensis TaxID=548579 RepID=A0A2A9ETN9_9MICO|nr:L-2-hydroxyglutarate oxidase [Isoptericola jiangsuensis]PFG41632.1 L-2-hydroxyglutarate oxidase LhgO [Isoptericola jiangsuensis]
MGESSTTFGVVGGGIVGLAVAREILRRRPDADVTVLEAEDTLGAHQTGHNSGVVHAGIYYRPGSLKADLCTRGRALLHEYCTEHSLPYDEVGKLVVAVDPAERARFDALEGTARANGVPGLRRVDGAGIQEIEPHATGLAALHSPHTAITDFVAVCRRLAADVEAGGGRVLLSSRVTSVERTAGRSVVRAGGREHRVERLVVCGGLESDRLAAMVGGGRGPVVVPFRGEYLTVRPAKRDLVRGMVYPVPDPRYPFLGVHFTRTVTGALEVGPNAVLALHRGSYRRFAASPRDVATTLAWPGFWHMAARHWVTGVREVKGSLLTSTFLRAAQRYVPDVGPDDVERGRCGLRAQAVARDGSLVDDFVVEVADGVTSVRNAPSPAATSSLAIAEHVVDRVLAG